MRILLVGDIVGRAGRRVMLERLAEVRREYELDLVVANQAASTVSILLGNGDGTFGAHTDFPVGRSPASVPVRARGWLHASPQVWM